MSDPQGFLKYHREEAGYRSIEERSQDWKEIYDPMGSDLTILKKQGARCMDCGVPFCQGETGCPVDNFIPEWNTLLSQGRWEEALNRLQLTNNFPEFTGKLCPAPCESACVLGVTSDPVTIKEIELSIVERGFREGWIRPLTGAIATGRKIAIVGSGPAGLAAAQQLARKGHSVTVFEKASQPGGLLRFGIPDFKFEKWQVDRRISQLEAEGVIFKTSVTIGKDPSLENLRESFDAVCLAMGSEVPRDLLLPGRNLAGIHFAMEYLVQQNQITSGLSLSSFGKSLIHAQGKNVVILGGGDTGSDCLGTALRQGAKSVVQLEIQPMPPLQRSSSTPWPQWPSLLRSTHAHEEGGHRVWSVTTKAFAGLGAGEDIHSRPSNKVNKVIADQVTEFGMEQKVEFSADLVLLALGFKGPDLDLISEGSFLAMAKDSRGNISTNARFMTSIPGVFAAGDVRRGASLIVWAISEGRKMAEGVHQFLQNKKFQT